MPAIGTFHLRAELEGHQLPVTDVDWSPDGRLLASCSRDRTVRVWAMKAPKGATPLWVKPHDDEVVSARFSPDGALLGSAGRDCRVRCWRVGDGGAVVNTFFGPATFRSVAWSPDGRRICAAQTSTIHVFDRSRDEETEDYLVGHARTVRRVIWLPDGTILSGGEDGHLVLWSLPPRRPVRSYSVDGGGVTDMAMAKGQLAIGCRDGVVRLWSTIPLKQLGELRVGTDVIQHVLFFQDGRFIAATDRRGRVTLHATDSRALNCEFEPPPSVHVAASHPQRPIMAVGMGEKVLLVDVDVTGRAAQPPGIRRSVATATSSPAQAAPGFSFPRPLVEAYRQDKLAVLFGSGLSMAKDVKGDFPRWNELPDRLLDQAAEHAVLEPGQVDAKRLVFKSGRMPLEGMLGELDTVKIALRGGRKYQAALNAIFRPRNAAPGDVHRALVELGVGVLATTNYDALLEYAEGLSSRTPYTWAESDKALSDIEDHRKVLFKIHGTADREETVVMTHAEYGRAGAHAPYQRAMSLLFQTYTFLLVGYGINDPLDLDLVFELNASVFGGASRTHYALLKDPSPTDRDRWQRTLNVQVLPYQDHADLAAILRVLRATKP